MMLINNLLHKLWEQDPGYFRLKQSTKTLLAVFIVMLFEFKLALPVKFFAAITAGFSMQSIMGNSRREQFIFILIAFPVYFICFISGYLSQPSHILSGSILIILGFLAIYLKKYGPVFSFAPIIAWSFAFLGIILPAYPALQWQIFGSMLFGFLVAGMTSLLVFPEQKFDLFYFNVQKFFKEYALMLQWLAHILIHKTDLPRFQTDRTHYKDFLFRITVINGEIAQNQPESPEGTRDRMNQIYSKQYALAKVISMIIEGFETLITQKHVLSNMSRSHLFTVFAIYAAAISNLDIEPDTSNHQKILTTLTIMEKNLSDFQALILQCINQQQSTIALVNIHLGLRLIFRNIQQLEQICEK